MKNNYIGDDDYYVFHSYNAVAINHSDNTLYDRELDLLLLIKLKEYYIEVKAEQIYFIQLMTENGIIAAEGLCKHG